MNTLFATNERHGKILREDSQLFKQKLTTKVVCKELQSLQFPGNDQPSISVPVRNSEQSLYKSFNKSTVKSFSNDFIIQITFSPR